MQRILVVGAAVEYQNDCAELMEAFFRKKYKAVYLGVSELRRSFQVFDFSYDCIVCLGDQQSIDCFVGMLLCMKAKQIGIPLLVITDEDEMDRKEFEQFEFGPNCNFYVLTFCRGCNGWKDWEKKVLKSVEEIIPKPKTLIASIEQDKTASAVQ